MEIGPERNAQARHPAFDHHHICSLTLQREILERLKHHPSLKSYDDIWNLLTKEEQYEIDGKLDPEFWETGDEIPKLATLHYDEGAV